ncbi:MAG TPA: hypothetical protein VFU76_17940 [Terriglobales bacterium]|nr:hypothetical protein [Terriglobales bacterium]
MRPLLTAVLLAATAIAQGLPPSAERIAFRYDDTHVIVRLEQTGGDLHDNPEDQLTPLPPPRTRNTGLDELGTSDELMARFAQLFGSTSTGQVWAVEADAQHSFAATVDKLAFASTDCGGAIDALAILLINPEQQRDFQQFHGDHFLAAAVTSAPAPVSSDLGLLPETKLSAAESKRLQAALANILQARLAKIKQPSAAEKRLLRGEGKLEMKVQRLRAGPGNAVRLYIRASWLLGDYAAYLMSAWATPPYLQLDGIEAQPAAHIRTGEFRNQPPDVALGEILGVFTGDDGWARVLLGKAADEGYEMEVVQLSPQGPKQTDIAYGYGC